MYMAAYFQTVIPFSAYKLRKIVLWRNMTSRVLINVNFVVTSWRIIPSEVFHKIHEACFSGCCVLHRSPRVHWTNFRMSIGQQERRGEKHNSHSTENTLMRLDLNEVQMESCLRRRPPHTAAILFSPDISDSLLMMWISQQGSCTGETPKLPKGGETPWDNKVTLKHVAGTHLDFVVKNKGGSVPTMIKAPLLITVSELTQQEWHKMKKKTVSSLWPIRLFHCAFQDLS